MEILRKVIAVVTGILYVYLGIYLIFNPLLNLASLSWMLAVAIFMGAVFSLYVYFSIPRELREPIFLWRGILELLFGVYLLAYGYITLPIVLPTVLAVWLLSMSVIGFIRSYRLRILAPRISNRLVWSSLAGLSMGLILLFHPLLASVFVAYLLAISLLYQGILYFVESIKAFSQD
ncbi:HdeD family acid-resistance protein [Streptococcus sp. ZJ93]|uniref:HdeD family acid-resistance protein n=1 Tax=Streptococcus handemini TaxID=3161188 RepID=UPI0032EED1D3